MRENLFFLLFLFILPASGIGQEFKAFTTKNGLPSNHIYDVVQDSKGFMWFGTNRGVVKYDGNEFKTFTAKDGLPNNDIWALLADFQGRVWFFSKSNYQGFIRNDSVYKFLVKDSLVLSPRNLSISEENIWIYDSVLGIHFRLQENLIYPVVSEDIQALNSVFSNNKRVDFTRMGYYFNRINPSLNLYIIVIKNELFVLDFEFNSIFSQKFNFEEITDTQDNYSGSLPNESFYISTFKGILFIDLEQKISKYYSFQSLIGKDKVVNRFIKGQADEIQLSMPGFLLKFDYDFNLLEKNVLPENVPNHKSFMDKEGNIWMIDLGNGITFYSKAFNITEYYLWEKNVKKLGMINGVLNAGISNDGFYQFEPTENKFFKFYDSNPGTIYQIKSYPKVNTSFFISNQFSLELKNNSLNQVKFQEGIQGRAKDLVKLENDYLVLTSFTLEKKNIYTNQEEEILRKQGLVTGILHNNQLFIGATDGLYIFEDDKLINTQLRDVSIVTLLSTKEHLFIGTDGRGVFGFNEKEFFRLKNTENLSIQRIIKQEDDLWVACQDGVFNIVIDTNDIANSKINNAFYEEDGLIENNTNDIYLDGNQLFAASDRGLVKLNIDNPIYFKKPKINFNQPRDTLIVPSSDNENVNISYSVLDFNNQKNLNISYRLLPNQKNWFSTNTRSINFSSLPPKFHTLEVKVEDHHGNLSIEKQFIKVLPAWWQTVTAKFSFALFAILFLGGIIKGIQLSIQKRYERKALQEKRILGLELKALRAQMNPHFVHNSLNAIQYFIKKNEQELSEKYLVKFSKLIRLFFEYSRLQNITLADEIALLKNYLEVEKLRFEEKLNYIFDIDERIDLEEYLIPTMILQPIVENAVNHGIFHKKGPGTVFLSLVYKSPITFQVIIEDDGIGMEKAKNIFNNSSKNYQSNSSNVLNERLALLKKSKEWDINYEIMNRSESGENCGTIVMLTFFQYELT